MNIRAKTVFRIALSMAILHAAPLPAAELGIDQLMHSLAKTRSAHAAFVEKKYLSMLDRPVESSGELLYEAPDRLEKRTLKPKPETLKVDGDTVMVERKGRTRTLRASDYPELASLIDSIRGTLAGDRAALERSYRLALKGDADKWELSLTPTDPKTAASIREIEIAGSKDTVRSVEILQVDGDRSVMDVEPIEAQ